MSAFLAGPNDALLFTDTEIWNGGEAAPFLNVPKMSTNAMICAAGCGCGFSNMHVDAESALRRATEFDTVLATMSAGFRKASVSCAKSFDNEPDTFARQFYVAAGWSHRYGRMLAYEFGSAGFFTPTLVTRVMRPAIDVPETWKPANGAEILWAARQQMAELRKSGLTGAGTGPLSIVHLQRDRMHVQVVPDFDSDARDMIEKKEKELCL